jgi:hypothetical protein
MHNAIYPKDFYVSKIPEKIGNSGTQQCPQFRDVNKFKYTQPAIYERDLLD